MRTLRRVAGIVAVIVVMVLAMAAAGWPVYVRPKIDALRHADAVFVLGGYQYDRYPYGMSIAAAGWAPNLVISNPNGSSDPWLVNYCSTPHAGFTVICFVPDPTRTRGEAQEFARIATEKGWRSAIVVTHRPQLSRARFILRKCFGGELIMVESPATMSPARWVFEYAYQTAGYLRNALHRGC